MVFFALLPAQMCGDARTQFNDGEGLFDIVVRTDGKTVVDVLTMVFAVRNRIGQSVSSRMALQSS